MSINPAISLVLASLWYFYSPASVCFSVVACPKREPVNNSKSSSNGTIYQSWVKNVCDRGYRFIDGNSQKTVFCNENGTWNGTSLDCKGIADVHCWSAYHILKDIFVEFQHLAIVYA